MKIRTKLTFRYVALTATVFSLFVLAVYLFSETNRSKEFYNDLKKEAVTKANLFLGGRVDAMVMHSIYMNNREFIDEVEVAVYTRDFELLYHDAADIDLVKENQEMIDRIIAERSIEFYQNEYQVVGLLYPYNGVEYVITAAAYDGYGLAKLMGLTTLLMSIWIAGLVILTIVGYLLARSALSPVAQIVDDVEEITERNLEKRLTVESPNDEIGELTETFNRMLDRLEKSFQSQKMFVSNVSHELRTPMAAFIMELELALLKERTTDEYKQTISQALEDARRLEKLSSGLLDLAKANYDPKQINMSEVRLDELLLDARDLVIKANSYYKVELLFDQDTDDDRMITVQGNEYLLKTAFINLIENNCKFSENTTSFIHISYFGENAILRFSDTGMGMSEEDMENMFDPFYRGTNKGKTPGHGIGMTLGRRIIDMHKGSLEVNSYTGEGTVFVVRLPHI